MHISKRWLSVCTSLAMVLGLLTIAAPAQAQPSDLELFQPTEGHGDATKIVLSDQDDNEDETAHLTGVSEESDADFAAFFHCEDTFDDSTDEVIGDCDEIAVDNEPADPGAEADVDDDDEGEEPDLAWEAFWDIPADDTDQQIWFLVCEGTDGDFDDEPNTGDTHLPENCTADASEGITLDDEGDNDHEYSSGEITGICVTDDENDPDDCDQDAEFEENGHGDVIEGDFGADAGFYVRASVSDGVDDISGCIDETADSNSEPDSCDHTYSADLVDPNDDTEYVFFVDSGDINEDDDIDLGIFCDDTDCEMEDDFEGQSAMFLDEHYKVVTGAGLAETDRVVLSIEEDVDDDADEGCDEDEDVVDEWPNEFDENDVNEVAIEGCIFTGADELSDGEEVSMELTGIGEFTECGESGGDQDGTSDGDFVLHDHDDDGLFEHCHFAPDDDTDGQYDAEIANQDADGDAIQGTQDVLFCLDDEATGTSAGTEANPGANHGCADEAEGDTDTITKHHTGLPEHVHLVFQGTGDPANPCHTGEKSRGNVINQTDTLLACTFDDDENPASTEIQEFGGAGDEDFSLDWSNSNPSVASFATTPPDDTPESGQATVQIRANSAGSTTITVELRCRGFGGIFGGTCPEEEVTISRDSISKIVSGGAEPQCSDDVDNDGDGLVDAADPGCRDRQGNYNPNDNDETDVERQTRRVATTLTIRYNRASGKFKGAVGSARKRCQTRRFVTLKKKRSGRNRTVGSDNSNRFGNWSVRKRRARGRFYAVVSRVVRTARNGDRLICLRDRSVTIRVRRRR